MVWWTDSDRYCVCRSKFLYYATSVDVLKDRIFQTTSIMYTLNNQNHDAYGIHSLTKSGVNMFNVDRTVHGEDFFQKIKEVIIASETLPEMYPDKYRSPIGLVITMTVAEPIDIDERVDIIILKDVNNMKELLDFKKKIKNNCLPVMLWIKSWITEDLKSMIQSSDGVVLDLINNSTAEELSHEFIYLCKQLYKPVFCVISDIVKDYQLSTADDLHLLAIAKKIFTHQFDGIMLFGKENDNKNERLSVQSLVRAMDVVDNNYYHTDVYKLSLKIKTPVLPWISTSLAASLAAKQCGAGAIIVLTTSGMSARWIANASPPCYILAITTREEVTRRLHLYRKVIPLFYNQTYAADWSQECWNRVVFGATLALQIGLCGPGTKVVLLAPFDQDIQYCNKLQILSLPLRCED